MAMMLNMQGISKSFFGVEVLHKVNFDVKKGQIMGLCGENGAGKSTLMKILSGIHAQDAGEIVLKGASVRRNATPLEMQRLGVSMIHQELNLLNELTVAQNIFLCRELVGLLGIDQFCQDERRGRDHLEQAGGEDRPPAQSERPEDRSEADGGDCEGHQLQRRAACDG